LLSIDLGFDSSDLLTFQVELPEPSYPDDAAVREFFAAARDEIASVPGVRDVGLVSHRPILGGEPSLRLTVAGRDDGLTGDSAMAATVVAGPGFFETVGIPLLSGRGFEARDDMTGVPVAIVSRAAAERYWPDADPIGTRVRVGTESAQWREVIGVVDDIRNPDANLPPEPHMYLPFAQQPRGTMAFIVRSSVPPAELAGVARDRVWRVDPLQPVDDIRTMRQIHRDDFSGDLAMISLIVFFGAVAFGLAVAGVYGVVSYSVSQRRREIGVRMAVGARSEDVLRMITRQGITQVLAGVGIGVFLGLLLSHSLTGMLYGVTPTDPVTFFGVPVLLIAVGLVASLIPARRAARLDPIDTLRSD
jgi:predicted permease